MLYTILRWSSIFGAVASNDKCLFGESNYLKFIYPSPNNSTAQIHRVSPVARKHQRWDWCRTCGPDVCVCVAWTNKVEIECHRLWMVPKNFCRWHEASSFDQIFCVVVWHKLLLINGLNGRSNIHSHAHGTHWTPSSSDGKRQRRWTLIFW